MRNAVFLLLALGLGLVSMLMLAVVTALVCNGILDAARVLGLITLGIAAIAGVCAGSIREREWK